MHLQTGQNPNFNSYDPNIGNKWDPAIGTKYNNANGSGQAAQTIFGSKPGQKMQVSLTLNNPSAGVLTFELFNYLLSFTRVQNLSYVSGNYLYIPLSSYEGIQALIATTDGTVGFSKTGTLQIRALPAAVIATIACKESPYASLFAATASVPFNVASIRQTVATDPQIDEPILYFQKSFSGGKMENNINPRTYFNPQQFQGKIIDIPVSFAIGQDTGFSITLIAGETVKLSLFIDAWGTQALVS